MTDSDKKNPAAVALGKRRWVGVPEEEAAAIRSSGGKATSQKMTAAQRKARAKKAVAARIKKLGQKKRKSKKATGK